MDHDYVEELAILTVIASILLATKIIACCLAFGFNQKHKAIGLRRDSLSIAKLNHLESGTISQEKRQKLVTCSCPRSPQGISEANNLPQISPKKEVTSPVNIPQKHLVSVRFQTAD